MNVFSKLLLIGTCLNLVQVRNDWEVGEFHVFSIKEIEEVLIVCQVQISFMSQLGVSVLIVCFRSYHFSCNYVS